MTGEDISSRNKRHDDPTFLDKSGFASDNGLLSIVAVFWALGKPGPWNKFKQNKNGTE